MPNPSSSSVQKTLAAAFATPPSTMPVRDRITAVLTLFGSSPHGYGAGLDGSKYLNATREMALPLFADMLSRVGAARLKPANKAQLRVIAKALLAGASGDGSAWLDAWERIKTLFAGAGFTERLGRLDTTSLDPATITALEASWPMLAGEGPNLSPDVVFLVESMRTLSGLMNAWREEAVVHPSPKRVEQLIEGQLRANQRELERLNAPESYGSSQWNLAVAAIGTRNQRLNDMRQRLKGQLHPGIEGGPEAQWAALEARRQQLYQNIHTGTFPPNADPVNPWAACIAALNDIQRSQQALVAQMNLPEVPGAPQPLIWADTEGPLRARMEMTLTALTSAASESPVLVELQTLVDLNDRMSRLDLGWVSAQPSMWARLARARALGLVGAIAYVAKAPPIGTEPLVLGEGRYLLKEADPSSLLFNYVLPPGEKYKEWASAGHFVEDAYPVNDWMQLRDQLDRVDARLDSVFLPQGINPPLKVLRLIGEIRADIDAKIRFLSKQAADKRKSVLTLVTEWRARKEEGVLPGWKDGTRLDVILRSEEIASLPRDLQLDLLASGYSETLKKTSENVVAMLQQPWGAKKEGLLQMGLVVSDASAMPLLQSQLPDIADVTLDRPQQRLTIKKQDGQTTYVQFNLEGRNDKYALDRAVISLEDFLWTDLVRLGTNADPLLRLPPAMTVTSTEIRANKAVLAQRVPVVAEAAAMWRWTPDANGIAYMRRALATGSGGEMSPAHPSPTQTLDLRADVSLGDAPPVLTNRPPSSETPSTVIPNEPSPMPLKGRVAAVLALMGDELRGVSPGQGAQPLDLNGWLFEPLLADMHARVGESLRSSNPQFHDRLAEIAELLAFGAEGDAKHWLTAWRDIQALFAGITQPQRVTAIDRSQWDPDTAAAMERSSEDMARFAWSSQAEVFLIDSMSKLSRLMNTWHEQVVAYPSLVTVYEKLQASRPIAWRRVAAMRARADAQSPEGQARIEASEQQATELDTLSERVTHELMVDEQDWARWRDLERGREQLKLVISAGIEEELFDPLGMWTRRTARLNQIDADQLVIQRKHPIDPSLARKSGLPLDLMADAEGPMRARAETVSAALRSAVSGAPVLVDLRPLIDVNMRMQSSDLGWASAQSMLRARLERAHALGLVGPTVFLSPTAPPGAGAVPLEGGRHILKQSDLSETLFNRVRLPGEAGSAWMGIEDYVDVLYQPADWLALRDTFQAIEREVDRISVAQGGDMPFSTMKGLADIRADIEAKIAFMGAGAHRKQKGVHAFLADLRAQERPGALPGWTDRSRLDALIRSDEFAALRSPLKLDMLADQYASVLKRTSERVVEVLALPWPGVEDATSRPLPSVSVSRPMPVLQAVLPEVTLRLDRQSGRLTLVNRDAGTTRVQFHTEDVAGGFALDRAVMSLESFLVTKLLTFDATGSASLRLPPVMSVTSEEIQANDVLIARRGPDATDAFGLWQWTPDANGMADLHRAVAPAVPGATDLTQHWPTPELSLLDEPAVPPGGVRKLRLVIQLDASEESAIAAALLVKKHDSETVWVQSSEHGDSVVRRGQGLLDASVQGVNVSVQLVGHGGSGAFGGRRVAGRTDDELATETDRLLTSLNLVSRTPKLIRTPLRPYPPQPDAVAGEDLTSPDPAHQPSTAPSREAMVTGVSIVSCDVETPVLPNSFGQKFLEAITRFNWGAQGVPVVVRTGKVHVAMKADGDVVKYTESIDPDTGMSRYEYRSPARTIEFRWGDRGGMVYTDKYGGGEPAPSFLRDSLELNMDVPLGRGATHLTPAGQRELPAVPMTLYDARGDQPRLPHRSGVRGGKMTRFNSGQKGTHRQAGSQLVFRTDPVTKQIQVSDKYGPSTGRAGREDPVATELARQLAAYSEWRAVLEADGKVIDRYRPDPNWMMLTALEEGPNGSVRIGFVDPEDLSRVKTVDVTDPADVASVRRGARPQAPLEELGSGGHAELLNEALLIQGLLNLGRGGATGLTPYHAATLYLFMAQGGVAVVDKIVQTAAQIQSLMTSTDTAIVSGLARTAGVLSKGLGAVGVLLQVGIVGLDIHGLVEAVRVGDMRAITGTAMQLGMDATTLLFIVGGLVLGVMGATTAGAVMSDLAVPIAGIGIGIMGLYQAISQEMDRLKHNLIPLHKTIEGFDQPLDLVATHTSPGGHRLLVAKGWTPLERIDFRTGVVNFAPATIRTTSLSLAGQSRQFIHGNLHHWYIHDGAGEQGKAAMTGEDLPLFPLTSKHRLWLTADAFRGSGHLDLSRVSDEDDVGMMLPERLDLSKVPAQALMLPEHRDPSKVLLLMTAAPVRISAATYSSGRSGGDASMLYDDALDNISSLSGGRVATDYVNTSSMAKSLDEWRYSYRPGTLEVQLDDQSRILALPGKMAADTDEFHFIDERTLSWSADIPHEQRFARPLDQSRIDYRLLGGGGAVTLALPEDGQVRNPVRILPSGAKGEQWTLLAHGAPKNGPAAFSFLDERAGGVLLNGQKILFEAVPLTPLTIMYPSAPGVVVSVDMARRQATMALYVEARRFLYPDRALAWDEFDRDPLRYLRDRMAVTGLSPSQLADTGRSTDEIKLPAADTLIQVTSTFEGGGLRSGYVRLRDGFTALISEHMVYLYDPVLKQSWTTDVEHRQGKASFDRAGRPTLTMEGGRYLTPVSFSYASEDQAWHMAAPRLSEEGLAKVWQWMSHTGDWTWASLSEFFTTLVDYGDRMAPDGTAGTFTSLTFQNSLSKPPTSGTVAELGDRDVSGETAPGHGQGSGLEHTQASDQTPEGPGRHVAALRISKDGFDLTTRAGDRYLLKDGVLLLSLGTATSAVFDFDDAAVEFAAWKAPLFSDRWPILRWLVQSNGRAIDLSRLTHEIASEVIVLPEADRSARIIRLHDVDAASVTTLMDGQDLLMVVNERIVRIQDAVRAVESPSGRWLVKDPALRITTSRDHAPLAWSAADGWVPTPVLEVFPHSDLEFVVERDDLLVRSSDGWDAERLGGFFDEESPWGSAQDLPQANGLLLRFWGAEEATYREAALTNEQLKTLTGAAHEPGAVSRWRVDASRRGMLSLTNEQQENVSAPPPLPDTALHLKTGVLTDFMASFDGFIGGAAAGESTAAAGGAGRPSAVELLIPS